MTWVLASTPPRLGFVADVETNHERNRCIQLQQWSMQPVRVLLLSLFVAYSKDKKCRERRM